MNDVVFVGDLELARLYCICGFEYEVALSYRGDYTVDEFLYGIAYHTAVHPDYATWDIGEADGYLKRDPDWQKSPRR